ncbi:MAG: helix-turn-helix domain-containing protein [Rhodospirillales bacterium]|nr:MAG: helix-turn-helix domain-containing protein [Rhodospirillales bacterium]
MVVGWRLRDSLERLRDPDFAEVSVAEIAYQCGFNDLSTFYRRFRSQFGMTPVAARRARDAGRGPGG